MQIWPSRQLWPGGAVLIVGIITLVIAGGFWNGWRIMWYLGVIFTALNIIMCVVSLFMGGFNMIIMLIIALIIMYYLFRPNVKEFFGI